MSTTTLDRLTEIKSDCEYAYYHDGVTGSLLVMSDAGNTLLPPHSPERWDVLEVVESREEAVEAARAWEAEDGPPSCIPRSLAEKHGRSVSYRTKYGSIGHGRLVGGVVYRSGGNGYYYVAGDTGRTDDVTHWRDDDGEAYMTALRLDHEAALSMNGWMQVPVR